MRHFVYIKEVALCARWQNRADRLEQQGRRLEASCFRSCAEELENALDEVHDDEAFLKHDSPPRES